MHLAPLIDRLRGGVNFFPASVSYPVNGKQSMGQRRQARRG